MTPIQIADNRYEQPEPHDEEKYRKDVSKEGREAEAAFEEHGDTPNIARRISPTV